MPKNNKMFVLFTILPRIFLYHDDVFLANIKSARFLYPDSLSCDGEFLPSYIDFMTLHSTILFLLEFELMVEFRLRFAFWIWGRAQQVFDVLQAFSDPVDMPLWK